MLHARRTLLQRIDHEVRNTERWTGRASLSPEVRHALEVVPREAFVPAEQRRAAYDNRPLPIGYGQTISQPFVVAIMVELLDPRPEHRMLEIGTGCGYSAAVLAQVVARVDTIEVVPELAQGARKRLADLGYDNIVVHEGDGNAGWPERAPYDGIVVTAAAPAVPRALLAQLARGGRMVVPLGESHGAQELVLFEKSEAGAFTEKPVLPVAFVPLVEA